MCGERSLVVQARRTAHGRARAPGRRNPHAGEVRLRRDRPVSSAELHRRTRIGEQCRALVGVLPLSLADAEPHGLSDQRRLGQGLREACRATLQGAHPARFPRRLNSLRNARRALAQRDMEGGRQGQGRALSPLVAVRSADAPPRRERGMNWTDYRSSWVRQKRR